MPAGAGADESSAPAPSRPRSTRIIEARARAETQKAVVAAATSAAASTAAAATTASAAKKCRSPIITTYGSVKPPKSWPVGKRVGYNVKINVDKVLPVFFLQYPGCQAGISTASRSEDSRSEDGCEQGRRETSHNQYRATRKCASVSDNNTSQAPEATGSSARSQGGSSMPHANPSSSSSSGSGAAVLCPGFKLHDLFSEKPNKESSARTGIRRRRPASSSSAAVGGGAGGAGGGGTRGGVPVPPPSRRTYREEGGFLAKTKDALVRCSAIIRGDDYDLDEDDETFLEGLHDDGNDGNWIMSMKLFEVLMERLEHEEARVRDAQVLVDATLRVEEERESTSDVLKNFMREGQLALNHKAGQTKDYLDDIISRLGERGGECGPALGNNLLDDGEGSDADSDVEADLARVERSRGPVLLRKKVGLPLMRNLVESTADSMDPIDPASRKKAAARARAVVQARAKAAAQAAKKARKRKPKKAKKAHKTGDESEDEEEEEEEEGEDIAGVPNEFLSAVFDYWAMKRENHNGPLLRCYHSFIMRRWTRMADPARDARYEEEGMDGDASKDVFKALDSHREDLDRARRIMDKVGRREALKYSALRVADDRWSIVDRMMGRPRGRAPAPGRPPVTKAVDPPRPAMPPPGRRSTRLAVRATQAATGDGGDSCPSTRLSQPESTDQQQPPAVASYARQSTPMASNLRYPPVTTNIPDDAISRGGRVRSSTRRAAAEARVRMAALAKTEAARVEDDYHEVTLVHSDGEEKGEVPRAEDEEEEEDDDDDDEEEEGGDMDVSVASDSNPPHRSESADTSDVDSPSEGSSSGVSVDGPSAIEVVDQPPVVVSDESEEEGEMPPSPPPAVAALAWPGREAAEGAPEEGNEMLPGPLVTADSKKKRRGVAEQGTRPKKASRREPTPREAGKPAKVIKSAAAAKAAAEAATVLLQKNEERARRRERFNAAQQTREEGLRKRQLRSNGRCGSGAGGDGSSGTASGINSGHRRKRACC